MIEWLLAEGRLLPHVDQTIQQLGEKLLAAGAPVWRLRLSMRKLHPLVAAFSSLFIAIFRYKDQDHDRRRNHRHI